MFLTFFIHRISFGYFDHVAHRWFGGTNESALHIQYVGLLHGLRASLFCAATLSCEHHLFPRKKVTNDLGICSFHSCDSNFKQASNSLERQAVPTTPMSSWIAWDQAFSASRVIRRLNVAASINAEQSQPENASVAARKCSSCSHKMQQSQPGNAAVAARKGRSCS